MLLDRYAAHKAALTRSVLQARKTRQLWRECLLLFVTLTGTRTSSSDSTKRTCHVSQCFGNNFAPEYIYCCRCSHRTVRMFAATQSDSDATLAKPASRPAFQSPTSGEQLLLAPLESSEFLCVTNIALRFPTMDRSTP